METTGREGAVVVEFFGMPGVGKSYLAAALSAAMVRDGTVVGGDVLSLSSATRLRRITGKLGYIARSQGIWWSRFPRLLIEVLRGRWRSPYSALKVIFNWTYVVSCLRVQRLRPGVSILDQGLFQGIWSAGYHAACVDNVQLRSCLRDALQVIGRMRVIVVAVEADETTVRERVADRSHGLSPLERGGRVEWSRAREVTRNTMEILQWAAAEFGQVETLRVDNNCVETAREAGAALLDRVRPLIGPTNSG